jgi:hypothetical protein
VQPFIFANFLIYKRFRQRPAPEKVRIIGAQMPASMVVLRISTKAPTGRSRFL